MRLAVACGMLAALCLAALAVGGAGADTIAAAGQRVTSPRPFLVEGEEVWAPLLLALGALGARARVTPEEIRISAAGSREVVISRLRPEATRDGVLRSLPGLPRAQQGQLLLPAAAVGSLLGCAVRWDAAARTLYLHPWVRTFRLDELPDRLRLTIAAEGPLAYREGRLDGPPRLFLDLLHVDLAAIPAELMPQAGPIRSARIRQRTLAPAPEGDQVRAVVELNEWRSYRIRSSDDRCRLEIEFPPDASHELPAEGPPITLQSIDVRRLSPRVAEVTIAVVGEPRCHSGASDEPPTVWVDIAHAEAQPSLSPPRVSDKLISMLSLSPSPERPGAQRLAITLKAPAAHALSVAPGAVRLLVGQLEMAALRVVVDPGHGGPDSGAVGRSGLLEKEVNLDIARRVARLLGQMGAQVVLTRTDDNPCVPWQPGNREEQRQELRARCALADEMGADLFVSIHANARRSNPHAIRGAETYFRKEDSRALAAALQEELVRATGMPDGGVKYHPEPIIVLYRPAMPSALVEVGYLSHPQDERLLADPEFREWAARGIVNGIRRYALEGGVLVQWAAREEGDSQNDE